MLDHILSDHPAADTGLLNASDLMRDISKYESYIATVLT